MKRSIFSPAGPGSAGFFDLGRFFRSTAAIAAFASLASLAAGPARAELLVRDDTGQEIRLKEPARRIVALAPHIAESLYAAGAGSRLVGTAGVLVFMGGSDPD